MHLLLPTQAQLLKQIHRAPFDCPRTHPSHHLRRYFNKNSRRN